MQKDEEGPRGEIIYLNCVFVAGRATNNTLTAVVTHSGVLRDV